jgi:hypothetical protein
MMSILMLVHSSYALVGAQEELEEILEEVLVPEEVERGRKVYLI